jgi:hypothetical protein
MRNVHLRLDAGISVDMRSLRADMLSTRDGQPPVFDDSRSYFLQASRADLSMDLESLTTLLNRYVFAGPDAPLREITLRITPEGRLGLKGKLHKGIDIPISLVAGVFATDDGRLGLHTERVSAVGVPVTGLLKLFGLEVDELAKLRDQHGLSIAGNDVIITPGQVLPPPQLRGRVSRAAIVNGALALSYAEGGEPRPLTPPDRAAKNYLYFSGSTLRFGKLTMSDVDLQLIDQKPRDWFDFYPAKYQIQLVAGYSKSTLSGGLKTYMPDYGTIAGAGR